MTGTSPPSVAIVDANGIIGRSMAGCFSLLPKAFDRLLVPPEVVECVDPPRVVQALAEAAIVTAARPYLDQMRQMGFGIPHELHDEILDALGELA